VRRQWVAVEIVVVNASEIGRREEEEEEGRRRGGSGSGGRRGEDNPMSHWGASDTRAWTG